MNPLSVFLCNSQEKTFAKINDSVEMFALLQRKCDFAAECGDRGLSYFSDIRVKPAAPGPKTPGGDPETGAAQRRGEAIRQGPLGLRVDLIQEHGIAQPLRQNGLCGLFRRDGI